MFNAFNIDNRGFISVDSHLRFYQEQTEEGLKDIPFAVWECYFNSFRTDNFYSNVFIGTLW